MNLFIQRGVNIYEIMKRPRGAIAKTQGYERTRGVMSLDILDELDRKNQERSKKLIKDMGEKWAHHPKNHVKRVDGKEYK